MFKIVLAEQRDSLDLHLAPAQNVECSLRLSKKMSYAGNVVIADACRWK